MVKKSFFRTILDFIIAATPYAYPSGVVVDNKGVCQTKEEQATCDSCICEGGTDDKPVVKKVRVKKTPVELAVEKAKRAAKKAKTAE